MFRSYQLILLVLPTLLYYGLFQYGPMYGIQIAFKDFIASKGIHGSHWVGLKNFEQFFHSYQFWPIVRNTLGISLYELAMFPIPIIMALLLNQLTSNRFKRIVQTVTYAPHFISIVVLIGMLYVFLSPRVGIVNHFLELIGLTRINFLAEVSWFKSIFVGSSVWQNMGFNMIIYLAALTAVNPELHEAAIVDGATKFRRILNVDLPGIMPTVVILFILNMGSIMTVGFEKIYLMQNPTNLGSSEVVQTYVYKLGLIRLNYSFSAAVGVFNSGLNFMLLISANQLMRRYSESSLW